MLLKAKIINTGEIRNTASRYLDPSLIEKSLPGGLLLISPLFVDQSDGDKQRDVVSIHADTLKPKDYIAKMRRRDTELAKGWGQIVRPLTVRTHGEPLYGQQGRLRVPSVRCRA